VKERILEFIAVGKLRGTSQGNHNHLCNEPQFFLDVKFVIDTALLNVFF